MEIIEMAGFKNRRGRVVNKDYVDHNWVNNPNSRHQRCAICGALRDYTSNGVIYSYPDGTKTSEFRYCIKRDSIDVDKVDPIVMCELLRQLREYTGAKTIKDLSDMLGIKYNKFRDMTLGKREFHMYEIEHINERFPEFNTIERLVEIKNNNKNKED